MFVSFNTANKSYRINARKISEVFWYTEEQFIYNRKVKHSWWDKFLHRLGFALPPLQKREYRTYIYLTYDGRTQKIPVKYQPKGKKGDYLVMTFTSDMSATMGRKAKSACEKIEHIVDHEQDQPGHIEIDLTVKEEDQ